MTVERDHVDAYAAVCGFPRKDTVPLTYPHLLAFPLHMAIMSDPAFPFPAIGTVHLENAITAHRADRRRRGARRSPTAVGAPAPARQGQACSTSSPRSPPAARPSWESTSTYLRRGRRRRRRGAGGLRPAGRRRPAASSGGCPATSGGAYAAVSGDHNPIHLYPLTARALGFPRQIAHGMWSMARSRRRAREPAARRRHRRGGVQEAGLPAGHGGASRPAATTTGCDLRADQPAATAAPHLARPDDARPELAGSAQRVRGPRIRPSWATVATSRPSSVNTRASDRPRAPSADGDDWS